jgi:hypothetical protein
MICGITFTCGCGRWILITGTTPVEATKRVKQLGWLKDSHGQLLCSKECLAESRRSGARAENEKPIFLNSRGGCA